MLNQKYNFLNPYYKITLLKKINRFRHFEKYHDETRSVFIHIPKAAGMSLVDAVYGEKNSKHSTCADYFSENSKDFKDYFKFTIVREPLSRCYSAYSYLAKGGQAPIDLFWRDSFIKRYVNFNEFVLGGGLEHAILKNAEHFIPQNKFICINDKVAVDYVGKYETLDDSINEIKKHIVFKSELKKLNVNKKKTSVDMSRETINKVMELYAKDYELLKY